MNIEKKISQDLAEWIVKYHDIDLSTAEKIAPVIELTLKNYKAHINKGINENTGVSMTLYDYLGNTVESAK